MKASLMTSNKRAEERFVNRCVSAGREEAPMFDEEKQLCAFHTRYRRPPSIPRMKWSRRLRDYGVAFLTACVIFAVMIGVGIRTFAPNTVDILSVSGDAGLREGGRQLSLGCRGQTPAFHAGAEFYTGLKGGLVLGIGGAVIRLDRSTTVRIRHFDRRLDGRVHKLTLEVVDGLAGVRVFNVPRGGIYAVKAADKVYRFQGSRYREGFIVDKSARETLIAVLDGFSRVEGAPGSIRLKRAGDEEFRSVAMLGSQRLFQRTVMVYSKMFVELSHIRRGVRLF